VDIDYENLRSDPFLFNKVQDCEPVIREAFEESPMISVTVDVGADGESRRVLVLNAASKLDQDRVQQRRFTPEEFDRPQSISDCCREMFSRLLFGV